MMGDLDNEESLSFTPLSLPQRVDEELTRIAGIKQKNPGNLALDFINEGLQELADRFPLRRDHREIGRGLSADTNVQELVREYEQRRVDPETGEPGEIGGKPWQSFGVAIPLHTDEEVRNIARNMNVNPKVLYAYLIERGIERHAGQKDSQSESPE